MAIENDKIRKGKLGEDYTVQYLEKNGYSIVARNYRKRCGEIDIVAVKDDIIAFVEVKTRSSNAFGAPAEAVDYKKQKKYRDIANFYIKSKGYEDVSVSFMVAEVLGEEINLISEAF